MKKPDKVTGNACLEYINKPLGFCNKIWNNYTNMLNDLIHTGYLGAVTARGDNSRNNVWGEAESHTFLTKVNHNTSKRIVGYVSKKYEDGGLKIHIMGDETLSLASVPTINMFVYMQANVGYVTVLGELLRNLESLQYGFTGHDDILGRNLTTDEMTFYTPSFRNINAASTVMFLTVARYNGSAVSNRNSFPISQDDVNTLIFGNGVEYGVNGFDTKVPLMSSNMGDPLQTIGGALYQYGMDNTHDQFIRITPGKFENTAELQAYFGYDQETKWCDSFNGCSLIYNLVLTESLSAARNYLDNGTLPHDAFLYPLDFENLPLYSPDTQNDDDDNGGDPDDDGDKDRITDDTPLVKPALTPTVFNANNVYWLNLGQLSTFLTWFWYDIQQFSVLDPTTWDNLFDNIEGLYADLAQAIISVRYMPVNPDYIGGVGSDKPIKLAQVQTDVDYPTIDTSSSPEIQEIGSYQIEPKFNSYLDLPPYTEIQLYLPYYGYIDLDTDIFMGHTLNVKAVYDWISGTIQYFLFVDNKFMVNMYLAKMCVDIPITLQSAYDRDRAVQNNTITALSGFMSAGASAVSGNPIGLALSAGAVASPQQSAPIKVEGMTGETGALYAPSRCAIIIRRPTTTVKGNAYARNLGYAWAKTATLSSLSGFTICQEPRIHFNGNTYVEEDGTVTNKKILPLDSEIDEIYNVLKEGAIL